MQDEVIKEFLVESYENLERLDEEFVALEKDPKCEELLSSIFRTFHTIKGTAGFLGFQKLEGVAHVTENILSQLRDQKMELSSDLVTVLLEAVDSIKEILASVESSETEGDGDYSALLAKLHEIHDVKTSSKKSKEKEVTKKKTTPEKLAVESQDVPAPEVASSSPTPVSVKEESEAEVSSTGSSESRQSLHAVDSVIRVDVALLDNLMNLVGELVLSRNQIVQFTSTQTDSSFASTAQHLNLITTELQENIMKTRMQPIGNLWKKLPRVVRDLAKGLNKQIRLEMEGAETELDKTIIEAIKDPLTHIVRNSADHGVELPELRTSRGKPAEGEIRLRAYHEGGQVNIEISDDGAGIPLQKVKTKAIERGLVSPQKAESMSDKEIYNLLVMPGFSMAAEVTNVSGRGVGMDVVKTNIEKIGGTFDIQSQEGQGTSVKIKIPLTLAIIPALIVTAAGQPFAIPQVSLLELVRLEGEDIRRGIERIAGTPVYRLRGDLLPLVYLDQILGLRDNQEEAKDLEEVSIVVLQADSRQFGLVVESVWDTEEIVVKPLGKQLKNLRSFAGATIMGDGKVALIIDVLGIAHEAGAVSEIQDEAGSDGKGRQEGATNSQTLLIFSASGEDRLALPLSVVDRLEEFPRKSIENTTAGEVIQYRGEILPLVNLATQLGQACGESQDNVQVIVFNQGQKRIGVLVDRIIDIVQETVEVQKGEQRKGIMGSAIVQENVVDLLDIHHVIKTYDASWFNNIQGLSRNRKQRDGSVLLVDGSPFFRKLLRSELEIAGYRVLEAVNATEALERLSGHSVNLIITELDLPDTDGLGLLLQVKQESSFSEIPVMVLTSRDSEEDRRLGLEAGLAAYQVKFDREAVLQTVGQLWAQGSKGSSGEDKSMTNSSQDLAVAERG